MNYSKFSIQNLTHLTKFINYPKLKSGKMKRMGWLGKIFGDSFRRYLIIGLLIIGVFLIAYNPPAQQEAKESAMQVDFFFHPICPHCREQKVFNEGLKAKFPEAGFVYHDITNPEENDLFRQFAKKYEVQRLAVPATFFGSYHFIGFDSAETSGKQIEASLKAYLEGKATEKKEITAKSNETASIPFLGNINPINYSIPALAVILGLVDGFNPCAMWVLVYLISLILSVNDRKKIWLLVGTFVFASGTLYFLFMAAWLNVFLLMGYMRPLTIILGLGALYFGVAGIREYIAGGAVCKTGSSQAKTMGRIEKIVKSPVTIATLLGIIALAFIVNSIEFACSSALPAIFTYVLSISSLSSIQYYAYILLYDFFFMLDDLIIFSLAAFAANTSLGTKYAKYCKLIGGIILVVLGFVLAFAPGLLR